jgi:hypothetical protein
MASLVAARISRATRPRAFGETAAGPSRRLQIACHCGPRSSRQVARRAGSSFASARFPPCAVAAPILCDRHVQRGATSL